VVEIVALERRHLSWQRGHQPEEIWINSPPPENHMTVAELLMAPWTIPVAGPSSLLADTALEMRCKD